MMKKKKASSLKRKNRLGISLKTSLACSLTILILLIASSVISIGLQTNLSRLMIDGLNRTEQAALAVESKDLKQSLTKEMAVNLEIFTSVAKGLLYSFDQNRLKDILSGYMKLEDIVAIKIFDADDQILQAGWKTPTVEIGDDFPDTVAVNEKLSLFSEATYHGEKVGSIKMYYTEDMVNNSIIKKQKQIHEQALNFETIAENNIKQSISIQVGATIGIVIILIGVIVMCLQVLVTRPIKSAVTRIKDIAQGEGDLTNHLPVKSRDEIGELAEWFNYFIDSLRGTIKDVHQKAFSIDSSSNDFLSLSKKMTEDIGNLSDRSNVVNSATEEMSSNMSLASSAIDEATSNTKMIHESSGELSTVISEIAKNAEDARTITDDAVVQTQRASDQVNELGEAAREIGNVVETITDISEQVNLLALNATIEAARAGDAGRGFGVVANEIKDLAKQTSDASNAIKEKVDGIQTSTKGTVDEIINVSGIVVQINEIVSAIASAVEEQSVTTHEIAKNISLVSNSVSQGNDNVSQGALSSQQVAEEMMDINNSSSQIADSSQKVKSNADELSNLAHSLTDIMNKFKV